MSNDELNKLVCERVLGWELEAEIYQRAPVPSIGLVGGPHTTWFKKDSSRTIPDFCGDWTAFGVLLTHLRPRVPRLILDDDSATARVLGSDEKTYCNGYDEAIQRALVLAALKAYGVEV